MTRLQLIGLLAGLAATAASIQAGPPVRTSIGIGFNFGPPVPPPYYYRPYPYWGPYYRPYYYPPPAVVVPAPVVYQPAPIVVQQPTVVQQPVVQQPAQVSQPTPVYSSPPAPSVYQATSGPNVDGLLANLRNTDDNVRRDSVMQLGQLRATTAVQPLTATLAGDQSPVVREAAARALALIGSAQALTALQHAAQADPDRDVRHSAQFAVDIIRNNPR